MSAMKDAFDQQAERGLALLGVTPSEWAYEDIAETASAAIADILHAVAQAGHDFRMVGATGIGWAEEGGADLYEIDGTRAGAER